MSRRCERGDESFALTPQGMPAYRLPRISKRESVSLAQADGMRRSSRNAPYPHTRAWLRLRAALHAAYATGDVLVERAPWGRITAEGKAWLSGPPVPLP